MAKIRVLSDLHLEWHRDHGADAIRHLKRGDEDVLVLAGDITDWAHIEDVLAAFCAKFPVVVYVLGNHEYYGAPTRNHVLDACRRAQEANKNLFWLHNNDVDIDGIRFHGGTMWFRKSLQTSAFASSMNDFFQIHQFTRWVYEENLAFCKFIERVNEGDVVVTHHLPSEQSVPSIYKTSKLNCFFVCEMEGVMNAFRPKLWIHGHTHDACDYMFGETRVVCNPYGYEGYEVNKSFDENKVVEV